MNDRPPAGDHATLRAAFDALLEQLPDARAAWLDVNVAAPSDRDTLRRWLAAEAREGALDVPAAERAARIGVAGQAADSLVGTRVGAFRLLALIGQGGMASVFLAERDDPQAPQRVAVKLLRRGLYSDFEQRLFRRERQALAALSHPDIARMLDGGVTDAGVPYLVLDHVDGVPITDHARAARLALPARLRLFVRVCRAVAAAHRAMIVHRDLKPSNILVDRDGRPVLLDFGIAKLLDDAGDDATGTGFAALTPGYAAPEQYASEPVSTATDVYALGVLLHELVLGERPGEGGARARDRRSTRAADATDADAAPTAPGETQAATRAPGTPTRRALRGDLGAILRHALEPEARHRYPDAAALADDLERLLDSRPVEARPPSARYRAARFVRRHRLALATAALFLAGLLASLGVALWQAREAREQAQRAGEVQDFLEGLFAPLEAGTAPPSVPALLQRGVQRVRDAPPDNPRLHADLLALFARLQDGIGETASNRDLARDAADAMQSAYGEDDPRTWEARALHGRVLRKLGESDAALAQYEAVRARMQARGVRGQDYARLLDAISIVRMAQGIGADEAIALKHEVLRAREADPDASANDLAVGYNNLGAAYQYAARFAEAERWYRRALDAGRREGEDTRTNANTLANLGHALSYQGRLREAADALAQARAMFARVGNAQGEGLASLLVRECMVLAQLERHADARQRCDEAVTMTHDVHGPAHARHAYALARRAGARLAAGDLAGARSGYAEAHHALGDASAQAHAIVGADAARLYHATGDWPALRDASLAVLDAPPRPGAPYPGTRAPSAPLLAAWAALACFHAPDAACNPATDRRAPMGGAIDTPAPDAAVRIAADKRRALAERVIDDPAFARSVLRFGAALVLAERDLAAGERARAAALLERARPWAAGELPPGHSWLARHAELLARAR